MNHWYPSNLNFVGHFMVDFPAVFLAKARLSKLLVQGEHSHHGRGGCWVSWHIPTTHTCKHMGVSENSVPLNPMVLLIIIPIKWLFHWEYTLFSDKPICEWYDIWYLWYLQNDFGYILGIWYMDIYGVWCMIWCMIWIDMMYVHIIF